MTITFEKPPINEVALGQAFEPVSALLVPHIGEFWTRFQDRYPKCQHAAPIVTPGRQATFDMESSMPRVWLISEDETRLVQIQTDRFYANWRQTKAREEYVRFPQVKSEFDLMFGQFTSYLKDRLGETLTPNRYELSYINVFDVGSGWAVAADIGNVLRDLSWGSGKRFLPQPDRVSMRLGFTLADDHGSLVVSLDPARSAISSTDVLRLEIVAAAGPEVVHRLSFDTWVATAHTWIVSAFKDLTTEAMHTKQWKLQET